MEDVDQPLFDDFFRAQYPGVVQVVAPIVGSIVDAEAVAQDAFLKAFVRWRRIGAYERPGAWVQRVAIRDAIRAAARARRTTDEVSLDAVDPAMSAVRRVDIARALAQLPGQPRAAVVLHHMAGWPVADVAVALGCAEGTVRAHLHRGRQALAAGPEVSPKEMRNHESP